MASTKTYNVQNAMKILQTDTRLICKKYRARGTQPLEGVVIPLLWNRVCTNEGIQAMSLAAAIIKARLSERTEGDD